jgi:hypothetical protein
MITAHPTENVLTQAASKAIEWKMRDVKKKRWTPKGAIGPSFGSNHIRFDSPVEMAPKIKHSRWGSK